MEDETQNSAVRRREKTTISKSLQIDSEVWFALIHEFLQDLFQNPRKDQEEKLTALDTLAASIGRNAVEVCADDRLAKYWTTKDVLNFIAIDVWAFLFLRKISNIIAKESEEIYLLVDDDFQFLRRIYPSDDKSKEYVSFCTRFVACLLKAMLRAFLIESNIVAESSDYIEYNFTIQIKPSQ